MNKKRQKGALMQMKNKIGIFDPKRKSEIHKKVIETQRRRKTGWFNPEVRRKAIETNKKNGTGIYNFEAKSKGGKASLKMQMKNKTGFCNPESQRKASEKGYEQMIKNKKIFFNGVYYGSKREAEIGLSFNKQVEKIKKKKNFQVSIGIYKLDFVNHYNRCVIEVHEAIPYFDKKETEKSYFKKRRQLLNENGYKNYNLLVIK